MTPNERVYCRCAYLFCLLQSAESASVLEMFVTFMDQNRANELSACRLRQANSLDTVWWPMMDGESSSRTVKPLWKCTYVESCENVPDLTNNSDYTPMKLVQLLQCGYWFC